jgi:hypothetical protein
MHILHHLEEDGTDVSSVMNRDSVLDSDDSIVREHSDEAVYWKKLKT